METIEPIKINHTFADEIANITKTNFERIGYNIGKLVKEKNEAYGDSFNKCGEFLKILYPNGVNPNDYTDMLGIVRVFDKMMRIANRKDAFGENPWNDIGGYAILRSDEKS
jgi:hypothetical protein